MPPADNNDPLPYSFDDQPPPPRQRRNQEEDESLGETVLDEIDEGLGISNRLIGCGWWIITLPVRIILGIIESIFD